MSSSTTTTHTTRKASHYCSNSSVETPQVNRRHHCEPFVLSSSPIMAPKEKKKKRGANKATLNTIPANIDPTVPTVSLCVTSAQITQRMNKQSNVSLPYILLDDMVVLLGNLEEMNDGC